MNPKCPYCHAELIKTAAEPPQLPEWGFVNKPTWERMGDWFCRACKATSGVTRVFNDEDLHHQPLDYSI